MTLDNVNNYISGNLLGTFGSLSSQPVGFFTPFTKLSSPTAFWGGLSFSVDYGQNFFNNDAFSNAAPGWNSGFTNLNNWGNFSNFSCMPTLSNWGNFDTFRYSTNTNSNVKTHGSIRSQIVSSAEGFLNRTNERGQLNDIFSPKNWRSSAWCKQHGKWGWCADFWVYNTKKVLGSKFPSYLNTSSASELPKIAEKHGLYLKLPSFNKNQWLVQNVKPGDAICMKGSGPSGRHISIVKEVKSDGTIVAINGNSSGCSGGKVALRHFNVNKDNIYGFISIDRIVDKA